jgi:hypothetical protein
MDHEFFAQLSRQQLENEDMVAPEIEEALTAENETVMADEVFCKLARVRKVKFQLMTFLIHGTVRISSCPRR